MPLFVHLGISPEWWRHTMFWEADAWDIRGGALVSRLERSRRAIVIRALINVTRSWKSSHHDAKELRESGFLTPPCLE